MHRETMDIIPVEEIPKDKKEDYILLKEEQERKLRSMNRRARRAWLRAEERTCRADRKKNGG